MFRSLPTLAPVLGAAGILPYILLGFAAVGANPNHALMATRGLVGYGAVILSFLGAVHWGFVLSDRSDDRVVPVRLALGVVPALIGWTAILLSLMIEPIFSLVLIIAGFIGVAVVETRAHRLGLMPDGYLMMRWVITVIVVLILTIVVLLRLLGIVAPVAL